MNIKLLREAYAIIDGIPSERINLDRVASNDRNGGMISHKLGTVPENCSTIACAAGWLGMHPEFRALGLVTTKHGYITWQGQMAFEGVLAHVFDCDVETAIELFEERTCYEDNGAMSDKQVWQHRVRKYLKQHNALKSR